MPIRKNNQQKLICPLLDRECLQEKCASYHADFQRCIFDLIAFNLYAVASALKNMPKQDQ